ncbi:MAG: NAD+ synthase [Candidatus Omnitrophota bacterium]|mgnify:FL=1
MKNILRLAMAQINTCVGDFAGNARKIINAIEEARALGSQIVCFPELSVCGYPPEDLLFKNSFIKENVRRLNQIKEKTSGIIAIVGTISKEAGAIFNSAAILADKKTVDIYHKIYLPNYGVFDEKRYFSSDSKFNLYALKGLRMGVNICEDIWVEDGVINSQSQSGANLILTINASPYHAGKINLRQKMLKNQAKKNKVFIAYINLVGGQDELVFDGQSMLISDEGKVLSLASAFKEELKVMDIDLEKLPQKPKSRKIKIISLYLSEEENILQPIPAARIKKLEAAEEVFSALVLGTRDYCQKNGFSKAILGLSGGIDSSLVAVIAASALGKDNVVGAILPSRFNSSDSSDDAISLASNLGIKHITIPIQEIFEKYLNILNPYFLGQPWNTAEENLQARIRGNILMALSNKFGWLVLTTGNKSEMGVGYATLYGDMAGGFAVIKDVPKTLVYKLSEFYNQKEDKEIIPRRVIEKAPTAELRENQKDSDSLPAYETLDPILKYYIEEDLSVSEIIKKSFKREDVLKTVRMVDTSEYKRRQSPPGVKITPRAFGRDRRMPIANKFKEA